MWCWLTLMPAFLALLLAAGIWAVRSFRLVLQNGTVNLEDGVPYISICGDHPPQSCLFSQVLNLGAAAVCVLRYHQLQDWGVKRWHNRVTLGAGLVCALGISVVGNFQHKHQRPVHLPGAFLTFFVGTLYFWLQLAFLRHVRDPPRTCAPWLQPLHLGLCSTCTVLVVAMGALHLGQLRPALAACEWTATMLLLGLFGLFSMDFAGLEGCALSLRLAPGLGPPPASLVCLQVQQAEGPAPALPEPAGTEAGHT